MESKKRKRKAWSVKEKLEALDMLKAEKTQAKVSKDMGISQSTLRGWIKDDENLIKKLEIR